MWAGGWSCGPAGALVCIRIGVRMCLRVCGHSPVDGWVGEVVGGKAGQWSCEPIGQTCGGK
eukprot:10452495-Alexandrium_andersonii.AAC.1